MEIIQKAVDCPKTLENKGISGICKIIKDIAAMLLCEGNNLKKERAAHMYKRMLALVMALMLTLCACTSEDANNDSSKEESEEMSRDFAVESGESVNIY